MATAEPKTDQEQTHTGISPGETAAAHTHAHSRVRHARAGEQHIAAEAKAVSSNWGEKQQ